MFVLVYDVNMSFMVVYVVDFDIFSDILDLNFVCVEIDIDVSIIIGLFDIVNIGIGGGFEEIIDGIFIGWLDIYVVF